MNPENMTPEELERLIHRELRALPPRKAPAGFEARFQARLAAQASSSALSPEQQLEQLVDRELRALPLRSAPRTLEPRVLTEIARRAALPWWRQDFAHWPVAMRGAFLVASAALATVLAWVFAGFDTTQAVNSVAADFAWVATVRGIFESVANFGAIVLRGISPVWLYGTAVAIVSLYAALFGLGTAAYRALYANR